jgi:hypothetical protein
MILQNLEKFLLNNTNILKDIIKIICNYLNYYHLWYINQLHSISKEFNTFYRIIEKQMNLFFNISSISNKFFNKQLLDCIKHNNGNFQKYYIKEHYNKFYKCMDLIHYDTINYLESGIEFPEKSMKIKNKILLVLTKSYKKHKFISFLQK